MAVVKNFFVSRKLLVGVFSLVFQLERATGQIVVDEEAKMLYYEVTTRPKKLKDARDFRDIFHKDKFWLGKKRVMGNISYNTGRVMVNDGHEIHPETRQALGFYTRIRFFEEFSLNTTFYKDFNPAASARWIADYAYSAGRYNWRPGKFNYGYENYINNKYSDNIETFWEKFLEGWYFVSYNHTPDKFNAWIRIDSTTDLKLIYFTRYSIRYRDENEVVHGGLFSGKPSFGVACRFTVLWNIYFESAVYYYPDPLQKQPWDSDYTYGFGYFDWRAFRVSVTYGNWGINRFPWNTSYYPYYGFADGNFKITANWMW